MTPMKSQHRSIRGVLQRRKRLIVYLLSFVAIVVVQTVLYSWGMARFEGDPRSLQESFGVVVQSITTTGYGQDAGWDSTFVSTLVILAQITGIAYVFVALPLFVVPWVRDIVVEPRVPDTVDDVADHVIVSGGPQFYSALIDDLEARDRPYLIVESDGERAKDLFRDGEHVITGDVTSRETLRDANVEDACAVVVDATEIDAIGTTLSVRSFADDPPVTCLIEDPAQSQYLRYAGASTVLSPKHRLGKSLADKARNVFRTEFESLDDPPVDLDVAEFPITGDSNVCGRRFSELDEVTARNVSLVGAWIRGEFVTTFRESDRVDTDTSLVVAGGDSELSAFADRVGIDPRRPTEGPVIVAGHGVVGTTADAILQKADVETTSVDAEKRDAVDVVGDATSAATLHEAGVDEAASVVVCVSDDAAALKATLVASNMNPDVEVIVAANDVTNANTLYRAGADYVLALPDVAARMTTLDVFEEKVMELCNRVELAEATGEEFEGYRPEDETLQRENGVSVVGVQRNGDVVTDFGPEFVVEPGDDVVVVGSAEAAEECAVGYSGEGDG